VRHSRRARALAPAEPPRSPRPSRRPRAEAPANVVPMRAPRAKPAAKATSPAGDGEPKPRPARKRIPTKPATS
jgi:hypothetical protein